MPVNNSPDSEMDPLSPTSMNDPVQSFELDSFYKKCRLCPRYCGVNRLDGELGYCHQTSAIKIAAAVPHSGEEPPISGRNGSGTVFFSGCTGGCFFCQNYQISQQHSGKYYSEEELYLMLTELIGRGVHNLNLVTPDHFLPGIAKVVQRLCGKGLSVPVVINSSGLFSDEALDLSLSFADIFLPDFKFLDEKLAGRILKFKNYAKFAISALDRIIADKGFLEYLHDEEGGVSLAVKGVLVRHLILPGFVNESIKVLRFLRERYGRYLPVSIMSQYTPLKNMPQPFNRAITENEFKIVLEEAYRLDFETVYVQAYPADSAYFPDFNLDNPFFRAE